MFIQLFDQLTISQWTCHVCYHALSRQEQYMISFFQIDTAFMMSETKKLENETIKYLTKPTWWKLLNFVCWQLIYTFLKIAYTSHYHMQVIQNALETLVLVLEILDRESHLFVMEINQPKYIIPTVVEPPSNMNSKGCGKHGGKGRGFTYYFGLKVRNLFELVLM